MPRSSKQAHANPKLNKFTSSQTQLNDIARLLNGRPRKTLGWKTPDEAMAEEMATFSQRVALDS